MAKTKDEIQDNSTSLGKNRRAWHDYFIEDQLECGIVLSGTEVKSLKSHHFNFVDSYVEITGGQMWLKGFQITPWSHGNLFNHDPVQNRRLLAHRKEIEKWRKKVDERGYTLVPLSVYVKNGLIKLEVGLCKGKKTHDKRDSIKARDLDREADRTRRERFD